jgi:hypothetical protein
MSSPSGFVMVTTTLPRPRFSPSAPTRQCSHRRSVDTRSPPQPSSQLSSAPSWWPLIDDYRKQGIAQLRDRMWRRRRSRLRCGRSLGRSWWRHDADLIVFIEAHKNRTSAPHIAGTVGIVGFCTPSYAREAIRLSARFNWLVQWQR